MSESKGRPITNDRVYILDFRRIASFRVHQRRLGSKIEAKF